MTEWMGNWILSSSLVNEHKQKHVRTGRFIVSQDFLFFKETKKKKVEKERERAGMTE